MDDGGVVYSEYFIEHASDGFRNKFSECDGIIRVEYQEYVDADGKLESAYGKGEWKTKSEVSLWTSEMAAITKILNRLTEDAE